MLNVITVFGYGCCTIVQKTKLSISRKGGYDRFKAHKWSFYEDLLTKDGSVSVNFLSVLLFKIQIFNR